jgi:hypothetical protein
MTMIQNDMMVAAVAPDVNFTALTSNNTIPRPMLAIYRSSTSSVAIVGFAPPCENIVSIDYRPATGQLYGLDQVGFINESG